MHELMTSNNSQKKPFFDMLKGVLSVAIPQPPSWWFLFFNREENQRNSSVVPSGSEELNSRSSDPLATIHRQALLDNLRKVDLQRSLSLNRNRELKRPLPKQHDSKYADWDDYPSKLAKSTEDSQVRIRCNLSNSVAQNHTRISRTLPISKNILKSQTAKRIINATIDSDFVDFNVSKRQKSNDVLQDEQKYTFRKPPSLFDPLEESFENSTERVAGGRSDNAILAAIASLPQKGKSFSGKLDFIETNTDTDVIRSIIREEMDRLHNKITDDGKPKGPRWTCVSCFSLIDSCLMICPICQCNRNPEISSVKSKSKPALPKIDEIIQPVIPITNSTLTIVEKETAATTSSFPTFTFGKQTSIAISTIPSTTALSTPSVLFPQSITEIPVVSTSFTEPSSKRKFTSFEALSSSTPYTDKNAISTPKLLFNLTTSSIATPLLSTLQSSSASPIITTLEPSSSVNPIASSIFSFGATPSSSSSLSQPTTTLFKFGSTVSNPVTDILKKPTFEFGAKNSFDIKTTSPNTFSFSTSISSSVPKFNFTAITRSVTSTTNSENVISFPSKFSFGSNNSEMKISSANIPLNVSSLNSFLLPTLTTSASTTVGNSFGSLFSKGVESTQPSFDPTPEKSLFGFQKTISTAPSFNFQSPPSVMSTFGTEEKRITEAASVTTSNFNGLFGSINTPAIPIPEQSNASPSFASPLFGQKETPTAGLFSFKPPVSTDKPSFQFGSTNNESSNAVSFGSVKPPLFKFGSSNASTTSGSNQATPNLFGALENKPGLFVFSGKSAASEPQAQPLQPTLPVASNPDEPVNPFSIINSEIANRKTKHPRKLLHRR